MQIGTHKVVSIHYTLRDNDGNIIDSSDGGAPLTYIQGIGNLILGMEEGLEGKSKGDKVDIKVSPEKGYGVRNAELIQQVPKTAFGGQEVKPGMQFQAQTGHGTQVVTITEVGTDTVTVDGNHALAGVELNFAVEVMSVREATKDELDHGHVHGEGGHHH
ncbi:MAG TPA: peptidylprolyl isomerase [Cyclobacteriaceae bacterium]|jgi:FKBP-type peptidyl-prolyl cis-trans isomerase SlyD|nr:peptidylprolyl isomerase [Cyclobacteriaceae bacterium]